MTAGITRLFPATGELGLDDLPEALRALRDGAPGTPFAEPVLAFMGEVSRRLLSGATAARYPQLTALGFWSRPAVVARLKERYESRARESAAVMVPRGLAFHLPPANVDVLFAYSWFLSLLAGNANLVRLPTTLNPVTTTLLDIARQAAGDAGIISSTMMVSYPHSAALNEAMSRPCDVRVVWGGDAKVLEVRKTPLPVRAIQLEFPDRFSFAVFKAQSYGRLVDAERDRLTERSFNDIYLFDQMGCASPRLIAWIGEPASARQLAKDFNSRLARTAHAKGYTVDTAAAIAKLAYADRLTLAYPVESVERLSNELTVITLEQLADFREQVMGAGTLVQVFLSSLDDLQPFLLSKDQTLVQFGFARTEMEQFIVAGHGHGIDRVVGVGSALDFHYLWDGLDLIASFTRIVPVS